VENITTSTRLKIRIKDIAKRAQVSVGTVDRVLHNRGEVSEETRTLVNNIINELEYKPNLIASSLASKKPFQIGVLLP
jgi:LacI family transcriptional regulator